jgi:hypothetical protein
MRPLEFLTFCFAVPLALALLAGMRIGVREAHLYCLLLLAVTVVQLIREGPHWQIISLYAVTLFFLLMGGLAVHTAASASVSALRWTGLVTLLLLAVSGVASYLIPMFRLPTPTGPHPIGTSLLYLTDHTRDSLGDKPASGRDTRELVIQLWYPARSSGKFAVYRRRQEAGALASYQAVLRTDARLDAPLLPHGKPWPLLIFNPAWTGQRTQSTFLMQELASQGFVVASIDHTWYSGRVVFPDGHVVDAGRAPEIGNFDHSTVADQLVLGDKYTRIEAEDDIFVLDQLLAFSADPENSWYRAFDPQRVGAFGHSIGGAAAEQAAIQDLRIRAVLNMDGWSFGDILTQGLNRPFMMMYEQGTIVRPPGDLKNLPEPAQKYWQMDDANNAAVEASLRRFGGYRLYIDGTSHWNFSDRALYSPLRSRTTAGTIDPMRAYAIIDRYVVAFFSCFLSGTPEPILTRPPSEYPEVTFQAFPGQQPVSGSKPATESEK